jgi:hypothetical protein
VTGMQTARLKAESQGRKAKVMPLHDLVLALSNEGSTVGSRRTNILCNSLPIHTMSYWSTYLFLLELLEDRLTRGFLQRVLVERPSIGWKLYSWTSDRERVVWQGLPGNP